MGNMEFTEDQINAVWNRLTYEEKNRELFERQKKLLDLFLEKHAISKQQHDKSLHDLTDKMNIHPQK